jgi:hypothetical protein
MKTYLFKTHEEVRHFGVWLRKKLGLAPNAPLAPRGSPRLLAGAMALANVAEGFRPGGKKTYYPVDQPYATRYLLVTQAQSSDTGASTLNSSYSIAYQDMCKVNPITRIAIPLGIATDEPGNTSGDSAPFSTNVALLGGAGTATLCGVADAAINAGTLMVQSGTTAGYIGALPATAGAYYTVGLSLSTSEGAATLIEFDPRPAWIAVQVQT